MKRQNIKTIPLFLLSTFISLTVSSAFVNAVPKTASPYHNLSIFARALAHIEASYVTEVDQDALIYGAIRGMLNQLDPHSEFLDPQEYRILLNDTEGRFGGIGVEIDVKDGWLTVVSVFKGGPADRAGVLPGDRFLTIDGRPARDLPITKAIQYMRGEPGTVVEIALRRSDEGDAIRVSLPREMIDIEAVNARILPDRTVYIQVRVFQENTVLEFREAIDEVIERLAASGGARGLILDLRDNPGGLLESAALLADEFLDKGAIVTIRGRDKQMSRQIKAHSRGTRPSWAMVVLVNEYSASAAEIVAGALQDHRRAIIIGTKTFGKGSVQDIIMLPDNSALKLTTAMYYTPNGRSIQAEGIKPDVVVEQLDAETINAVSRRSESVSEASLEGHLKNIRKLNTLAPKRIYRDAREERMVRETATPSPFPDDYQARVGHQILQAIIIDER
ncbi:MAG: S41 family peptidase [Deltaproteobacteria bacterium]|nr:S41 family peptidase [Deltaproteobacteria bacterium]